MVKVVTGAGTVKVPGGWGQYLEQEQSKYQVVKVVPGAGTVKVPGG